MAKRRKHAARSTVSVGVVDLNRPQLGVLIAGATVSALVLLSTSVGSVDAAVSGQLAAAETIVAPPSTSPPLAAEWFAQQATTTTATPPVATVPLSVSTTTTASPTTTTTAPDPMAGMARYDVTVGAYTGPAFRLSDVEPGRVGRAVLACACHPDEVLVGGMAWIGGVPWQVYRTGSVSVSDLHSLLDGDPVVPVVLFVSSLDGESRQWIEVR